MEEWIMCEFDDRYFISNFGNIKRILANGDERHLKPSILNKGKTHPYYYIQMCKKGKRTNYLIHRLVALAFCEGHSDINNVCDHIDRNTFNNHYTNRILLLFDWYFCKPGSRVELNVHHTSVGHYINRKC